MSGDNINPSPEVIAIPKAKYDEVVRLAQIGMVSDKIMESHIFTAIHDILTEGGCITNHSSSSTRAV